MNRIRFSCFALLAAAAVACNKDDIITREEAQAPVIAFDVNTGVYTAKVGREFTIAPTYEYVDRAVYAWKLEKTGRIISTEPVLTYVIDEVEGEEKEDYYIELEVTTPQGTTREQTRVEVYRILPPVIVLSEGAEVVRGHVYEISPDVRWGEKATYRWTMRRPGAAEAEEVGREQTYEFCEQALGEYELRLRAENEDGADEKSIRVEVTEALPVSVTVPPIGRLYDGLTRTVPLGRSITLRPSIWNGRNPRYSWTVDGEGKAMHKSLGNGVDPADVFNENGADILRLWAASADYHADVRCSKEIFKQLSQNYLKFRNTCKFMLDNLVDFDPEKLTKPEDMPVLDRWLLTKLNELIEKAEQSYCDYEFHIITHAVNDFCVNTLSSFYLDIVKDRLYCEGAESATRRSAQTALYLTLHTLSKLFAPILAFTCDEIWLAMPHAGDDDARNVVLNEMNKPFTAYALDSETMARWEHIIAVRTVVNGALEEARAAKVIGKSLEADVHLTVPESDRFFADESPEALADIFIVSKVELAIGDVLAVKVDNAAGTKCPRCWKHSLEANAEGLCPRCAEVVKHLHLTELL